MVQSCELRLSFKTSNNPLCGLLHLVMRLKTCTIRIAAAAGTNLAGASNYFWFIICNIKVEVYNAKTAYSSHHGDLLDHT